MKVLIVDDNTLNRKLLRAILAAEGDTVIEAEDGVWALDILEREKIDAVISDILMPRMDGYRLCYEIRKSRRLSTVPFIIYTATYTSPSDEKVAIDFGADMFIRKPASPGEIINALHHVMESTKDRCAKQLQEPEKLLAMREYSEALVRKLEDKNIELHGANRVVEERAVLAEFDAEITNSLIHKGTLREILRLCASAMVKHLEAALARIWTYNPDDNILELQASAGIYTHIDGGHSHVPVGQFKIGLIASERKAHLTNSVIGDPRVHDQEWAKREGMVAFAGYPLIIEDRLVGVMALFARKPLSQNTLQAMESVAKGISVGVERKRAEETLRQSEQRFRELAENIREIFFVTGPDGTPVHYVSPAFEEMTGRSREGFAGNPRYWLEAIHPEDRSRIEQAHRTSPKTFVSEYRFLRPDDSIRWIQARSFPVSDDTGAIVRIVGIAEDITERKRAEAEVQQNLQRIRALHEIDTAISSTLDLRRVLEVLLEKIELFLPIAAATTVRLLNRETGKQESLACRGLDEREWRSQQQTRGQRTKRIVETKAPLAVRNVLTDQTTFNAEIFRKHGLVSYLGVPLIAKGAVLGVLSLYTNHEHEFLNEEIEFLKTLAGQAAIAIHNARLHEEMVRSNKVKDEFLSVMSHELRTPLNVIIGYAGLLQDGVLGEVKPGQEDALKKVLNRSNDLLTMINSILYATSLEADEVRIENQEVNVASFLAELRADCAVTLDKKLNLIWDCPPDLPAIPTDSKKLKHVLQNLIHNAIKFTERGGVTISAAVRNGGPPSDTNARPESNGKHKQVFEFKVADTGIGIPKEAMPIIFEKFRQLDSSETRTYGGVGLGLYIVKKFTDLLGGTVEVESEPGKGSTFTVRIPYDK